MQDHHVILTVVDGRIICGGVEGRHAAHTHGSRGEISRAAIRD
jgi:hypothetical protein